MDWPFDLSNSGLKSIHFERKTAHWGNNFCTERFTLDAGGSFIPPFAIFPRQTTKAGLKYEALLGSEFARNPSGWIETYIFIR